MRTHPLFLLAAGFLTAAAPASAVLIDFDTDADYDNNFVETANPTLTSRNATGHLLKNGTNATAAFFNDSATGGSGGSGGTTFGSPRDTFGGSGSNAFTIQADFSFTGLNSGNSFGFYLKANDTQTSAYAVLWRSDSNGSTSGGNADVRFFESASAASAAVGSLASTGNFSTGTPLTINTWYTARLFVEDVGSNVTFTASLFNQGGSQIGSSMTWTDTTSALTGAGQVAMRFSTADGNLLVDNFSVTVVPEPSTAVALLSGFGLLALFRRRAA